MTKVTNNNLIVIAEDSPTQAEQLKYTLENAGYRVVHGINGKEAFSLVKKEKPLLLISDILMPVMDGYELCKKVKNDSDLENIPVMLLTTLSDPSDIIKGLVSKADNFITRPFKEKDLLSCVKNIIINQELRKGQLTKMGFEIHFAGERHHITSNRLQILDLLLSSFENFIQKNIELNETHKKLDAAHTELREINLQLENRVEERTSQISNLNRVLKATRNVNQLIITENNPNHLIQRACELLTEDRGYESAWIALYGKDEKFVFFAESGLGNDFIPMKKLLKEGKLVECCRRTLKKSGVIIIKNPGSVCKGCPLLGKNKDCREMSIKLKHRKKLYGFLSVSLIKEIAADNEEKSLFTEVAGDIAFALHDIELEKKNEKARIAIEKKSHELNERVKELNCLYGIDEISTLPGITLPEILNETIHLIQISWQYPEITEARITLKGEVYQSENFRDTKWMMKTDIDLADKNVGSVEVCYLKRKPDINGGPFLDEEIYLLQRIAKQLSKFILRLRDEENLKKSEFSLKEAQHMAKLGNWTLDHVTNDLQWSDEIFKIFGVDPSEFEATYEAFLEFIHPDDREFVNNSYQDSVKNNTPYEITHRILRPDGVVRYVHEKSKEVKNKNGKPIRSIGTVQDITERVLMEKELVAAKEKAEESDRLKSSFLSNMSHEIRTPLNVIVGFSDMFGNDDIADEEKVRFVPIIQENTSQLLSLIDDILDLSKMESDQLKIFKKECRVGQVLENLVDVFNIQKTQMGKNEIDIRLKTGKQIEELSIHTDPVRLQQVLSNLIDNSLKFTEAGFIEIGCSVQTKKDRENDKFIQFWVKDTGIGISEKGQKMIFERFTKIEDDETKLYRGTGLGLAISKRLVNILGGEMWVESTPGKGSIFYFTIPAGKVEIQKVKTVPAEKAQEPFGSDNWDDKSILVAEDEESNFKLIEILLKKKKANITWVTNGKDAVDACKSKSFDLVIMDIKMPIMDGLTATKKIKIIKKELPVIAVTAYAREEEQEESHLAGCDDIVVKPINMEKLLTTLSKYF